MKIRESYSAFLGKRGGDSFILRGNLWMRESFEVGDRKLVYGGLSTINVVNVYKLNILSRI